MIKITRRVIAALAFCIALSAIYVIVRPSPLRSTPATVVGAAACPPSSTPTLATFTAEGFSAHFPCPPTRSLQTASTPFGQITIITYAAEADGVNYAVAYVNYADLLPGGVPDIAKGIVLDGAKRSVTRGQPVKNPVYKDIKLGDYTGQDITASGDEKKLHGRIYLVKNITYQLLVVAPTALADDTPLTAFLDSFQLTPDP